VDTKNTKRILGKPPVTNRRGQSRKSAPVNQSGERDD
jgi:hypothetical protein